MKISILFLSIIFLSFAGLADPAATVSTEGSVCTTCVNQPKAILEAIPIPQISDPVNEEKLCLKKASLFDPKFKSVFEKNNLKLSASETEGQMGESLLSCVYGLGRGAFLSVKDLLNLIPFLVNTAVKGGKFAYQKVKEGVTDTSWVQDSVKTVADFSTGIFKSTKEAALSVWKSASTTAKAGYLQAGVGGAASALAVEAYENSPHNVIGDTMTNMGRWMNNFVGKEWDAIKCMSPQGRAQTMCTIMGYIVADVATGKLIWGNLAKSEKIIAAIELTKKQMLRTPIVGDLLMTNYKKVDQATTAALENKAWKVDGKMRLEGKPIDVIESEGKVFARGLSPKTGSLTTYEVSGSAKKDIQNRLVQSEKIEKTDAGKIAALQDDFFNPQNPKIARSSEDFVRGTNREVAVDISDYHVKKMSQLFTSSPETAKDYGELLSSVSEYKKKVAVLSPKKMTKEQRRTGAEIDNLLKEVNGALAHSKPTEVLNISNIKRVIEEAIVTGDNRGVEVYRNAVAGLNNAGGPAKFDAFFVNAGSNRVISEELRGKVRSCLISGVK